MSNTYARRPARAGLSRNLWSPRTVCSSNIWSPLVTDGPPPPPQSACVSIARLFHEDSVKRLIQIKARPAIELSLCSTGCHCYKLIKPAWMSFGVLIHNYFGNEESFSKQHRRQYFTARVLLERVCQPLPGRTNTSGGAGDDSRTDRSSQWRIQGGCSGCSSTPLRLRNSINLILFNMPKPVSLAIDCFTWI